MSDEDPASTPVPPDEWPTADGEAEEADMDVGAPDDAHTDEALTHVPEDGSTIADPPSWPEPMDLDAQMTETFYEEDPDTDGDGFEGDEAMQVWQQVEDPQIEEDAEAEREAWLQAKRDELIREMDELKEDLFAYRRETRDDESGEYEPLTNDDEYRIMLEWGDFTAFDDEYMMRQEMEEQELSDEILREVKARRIREEEAERAAKVSIDWSIIGEKEYVPNQVIREFQEDPEVIGLQLAQMRRDAPPPSVLDRWDSFRAEIPMYRQDVERFVGESLLRRAGILLTVAGVIILYRFAIGLGYVPEWARITLGAVMATGLLGGAHYLLRSRQRSAIWMVVAAVAVLYYTVHLAFADYRYLSQLQSFWLNVGITVLSVAAALFYRRKELAIVAILGGYFTPFLARSGLSDYLFFFPYIFLLNLTMVTVAYLRNWRTVNIVAHVSTVLLLSGWALLGDSPQVILEQAALLGFTLVFYVFFFVINLGYNLKAGNESDQTDYRLLLLNKAMLGLLGLSALGEMDMSAAYPWFFGGWALFHLIYLLFLYRNAQLSEEIRSLMVLSVTLSALAAGFFAFEGVALHNFWAVSSVLLLWLGVDQRIRRLKDYALFPLLFMLAHLVGIWVEVYTPTLAFVPLLFNRACWAGFVTLAALLAGQQIVRADPDEADNRLAFMPKMVFHRFCGFWLLTVAYTLGLLEISLHTYDLTGGTPFRVLIVHVYSLVMLLVLRSIIRQLDIDRLRTIGGGLMALTVLAYLFVGHPQALYLRDTFLENNLPFLPFGFHYLNVALSILSVYLLIRDTVQSAGYADGRYGYVLWFMGAMAVAHVTFEFENLLLLVQHQVFEIHVEVALDQIRLTGFSVLWTLLSVGFISYGIRYKVKELRVIALVLFGFTLGKFFLFDFWQMEILTKVFALIFLGLVLTAVSFLYENLKIIITEGQLIFDRDQILSQAETTLIAKLLLRRRLQEQRRQQADDEEED